MARFKVQKGVTLIAPNTEVVGDIRFKDQLYVSGHVDGNVLSGEEPSATLIISEEGSVNGEIRVPNVVINGTVEGNVYASARVELATKARVTGNVYYQLIEMQLGAMVDGQLLHEDVPGASNVHRFPADGSEPESVLAREGSRSAERT
jgi:cytoskeletal protein CcmA (bactofilin family)